MKNGRAADETDVVLTPLARSIERRAANRTMAFFVTKCSMIGSGVAHFSIPSSVYQSVGLCRRGMGKQDAKQGTAKGEEPRAKSKEL